MINFCTVSRDSQGAGELSMLLESPGGSALDESSKPTNRGCRNTSAVVTDGPLCCRMLYYLSSKKIRSRVEAVEAP